MQTKWYPADRNNFEQGRKDGKIELIVLHWSAGEFLNQTDIKFINPRRLASAHYAIENTEIHQYVKDQDTAFHSGSAEVDRHSLGVIVTGGINMPVTGMTYQTLALMLEELCRKYHIPIDSDHIKGHKEITPGNCPGTLNLERIVKETKALSPPTVIEKLKYEKEELQTALHREIQKPDLLTAKLEQVSLLLEKKDRELQEKIEEFVYLEIRNEKLEEVIKELLEKNRQREDSTIIRKIRRFFNL